MGDQEFFASINRALEEMNPSACWREFTTLPTEVRTDLLDAAYWMLGKEASSTGTRKVRDTDGVLAVLQFSIGNPALVERDEEGPYVLFPVEHVERMDRLLEIFGPARTVVLLVFTSGVVTGMSKEFG